MSTQPRRRGRKERLNQAEQPEAQPPVWPGVEGGRLKPLTEAEVALVEESTLSLLENAWSEPGDPVDGGQGRGRWRQRNRGWPSAVPPRPCSAHHRRRTAWFLSCAGSAPKTI